VLSQVSHAIHPLPERRFKTARQSVHLSEEIVIPFVPVVSGTREIDGLPRGDFEAVEQ
jgi:hypothetical protein